MMIAILFRQAMTYAQSGDSISNKIIDFPSKLFSRIQSKAADIDKQLTRQSEKYLAKMAQREDRIRKKLYKIDSTTAKSLFTNSSQQQYKILTVKLKNDTGSESRMLNGYYPYADSLKVSLAFLQQHPQMLNSLNVSGTQEKLQSSISQLQQLQTRMQNADQARQYVRDRKEQIRQYLAGYTHLPKGLSQEYQGLNQDLYYYTQQVKAYKDMLNDPDKMEKKALGLLNQLPVFQSFLKNNSQLAGLFGTPPNYGTVQSIAGLQTRSRVQQLIQGQLPAVSGGPNAQSLITQNLQTAQSELSNLKDKLNQYGEGGKDMDGPGFRPNSQRTKSIWNRLEYGIDMQTQHSSYYYPTTTDLGLSVGYRLSDISTIGIGASAKIGLGSDIQHISFSGAGAGLRSFIDMKLKGSIFISGGFEYNYQQPYQSISQLGKLSSWQQSGLIGLSKIVSLRNKTFKKVKIQLLWDFLSYEQTPPTQPLKFRIGYNF